MATIKSYTDLSQSRKLADILPLESADMLIGNYVGKSGKVDGTNVHYYPKGETFGAPEIIYAWSLAALLGVLPNNENISTNLSKGGYRISTLEYTDSWFVDYEDETNGLNNCVTSADNPIDACVEMIERLHELNLL